MAAAARTRARAPARTGSGRVRWDRIGRVALLLVLVGMAYLYVGPTRNWISTYREAQDKRTQVAELERKRAALRARAKELRDPRQLEAEARRLGMVRQGERAYVIEGLPGR